MNTEIKGPEKHTDLAPLPSFEGAEIRVFAEHEDIWISVSDVARAVGYARQALHDLIARNQESFSGHTHTVSENLTGKNSLFGNQGLFCVNEQGLYTLLGKMQISRVKNPVVKQAVVKFQRWIPELIQAYRRGELVQPRDLPITKDLLQHNIEIALLVAHYAGVSKELAIAAAMEETARRNGDDTSWCRKILPSRDYEVGTLNATALGKIFDIKAHAINKLLEEIGFQEKSARDEWTLTNAGKPFAEAYPYDAKTGHSGYQILWKRSVIQKIDSRLEDYRNLQSGLTGYFS